MLKVFDFEKTPIVDIVNEILVDASNRGASDIHFDPKDDVLQIRIRIDGRLVNYATVPNEYIKNLITRIKIISGMNITESRLPQDGAIKGKVKDIELDLRVSSINTNKGEKIVIRILDYTLSLNGIENLGFSDYNYKKVIEMINEPNGIILVTGATGTGKTTTVYSMLQRLSNETTNIMSIEDPVEMDIDNVNQIQVNNEIGLTFATALRSILRQDPNIIMIGEIRDSDTATIAIRASVTGHLVLSTLHTNDSLSTIERLLDMDVEKYLLAEALEGIISQKLARRLCPHCKKLRKTTPYEKELIKKTLDMDVDEIYEAVGCEKCHRGYKGRIAFQEVLKIDQKIQDALSMSIRKDKLRNLVYNDEVITLLQDGMIKVLRGDTTIEELLRLVEFDDDTIITYNLPKDILDTELNKELDYLYEDDDTVDDDKDESEDDNEFIIPDTSDVKIDSIDTKIDNNISNEEDVIVDDDNNIDTDNMESLDTDEEFIEKIDEVIEKTEKSDSSNEKKKEKKEKKEKKKNRKKKKNSSTDEETKSKEVNEENKIDEKNIFDLNNQEQLNITNVEIEQENNLSENITKELDENDDAIENKEKNIEKKNSKEKKKKIKKEKKKKDKKEEISTDNIEENKEVTKKTDDKTDSIILEKEAAVDSKQNDEIIDTNSKQQNKDNDTDNSIEKNSKEKENDKDKDKKKIKKKKKDDSTIPKTNDIIDTTKQEPEKNDDNIEINSDDTFITKIEKYVKTNNKKETFNQEKNNEITDNEIAELEEAIETIKETDIKTKEDNSIKSSEKNIDDTIKISISNNENDELNVSEVKTVNKIPKENDEMANLDFNTDFIDKIYDSINNTSEFKPIEKDNIDYEKVERLESMKEDIDSRVSRMMNKKRYRKTKKDE